MRLFNISPFVTEMVLSKEDVFCQYTQPYSGVPASSHGEEGSGAAACAGMGL